MRTVLASATNLTVSGVSNTNATKEPLEPDHAGNAGGKSLWWSWRAPVSGKATLDTFGSSFDTLLAIYTGDSLTNLALVASNNDYAPGNTNSQCSFNAVSNSVYAIAVDGIDGAEGFVVVRLNQHANQFIISSEPRDDFAACTDVSAVTSLLETNGTLYVGGLFEEFDRPRRAANLIGPSGLVDPTFPRILGTVFGILPDGEGGWFVGGVFNSVGSVTRSNLVHILPDHTVDPAWNPGSDGLVSTFELDHGILYVAGKFRQIGGEPRNSLAALMATNGAVIPWNPNLPNDLEYVESLALGTDSIYVGGHFTSIGGQTRTNLAEIDLLTGQVTPWNPSANGEVTTLAVSESHVYAAGLFTDIGGRTRVMLGSVDRVTGLASKWTPAPDQSVWTLKLVCNTLYVAGRFDQIGGQTRHKLAAFDIGTGALLGFDSGPNDGIARGIDVTGNILYVGGRFTSMGGQSRTNLAALDILTGRATDWAPTVERPISFLAAFAGTVLVDGSGGGFARKGIVALDAVTGDVLPWAAPSLNAAGTLSGVWAMAKAGNSLYVGGNFTDVGGGPRNGLAALDVNTGALRSFNPAPASGTCFVRTLAAVGSRLYVGGQFAAMGGSARNNIAALSLSTGLIVPSWNPNANNTVLSLLPLGTNIYAAGGFSAMGGATFYAIAALSSNTGLPTLWGPLLTDRTNYVGVGEALLGTSDQVYLGGIFDTLSETNGTTTRSNLAALNLATGTSTAWNPSVGGGEVTSLGLNRDVILVGGSFQTVGATSQRYIAAIDSTTGLPTDWRPQFDFSVSSLQVREKAYFVGGDFIQVNGRSSRSLAVFAPEGSPRIVEQPDDLIVPLNGAATLRARASGQEPLVYQWRRNGTNIAEATNSTFSIASAQLSDTGKFDVRVKNGLGVGTSLEVLLTVFQAPVITAQPLGQTALPGDNVTFSVTATGTPTPRYQWQLNGANMPGSTGPALTLNNVQITNSGSYSVTVANVGGGLISSVAALLVQGPLLPFADNLADRGILPGASGVGTGDSTIASPEPGEPDHAGKPGGKSVWASWTAPDNGIATFSTRGSSFDTLLGIYAGTAISNLAGVAADEDRGGFFTSQASFNAVAGTEYLIAIDGFAGASGNIVLSWNLDTSTVPFPRIINQPLSQTTSRNGNAMFFVDISSPTPVTYQWFFGCRQIEGATNASLTIVHAQRADVGNYRVFVVNVSSKVAESLDAFLEIGPVAKIFSHDKLEDLLNAGLETASTLQRFNVLTLQPLSPSGASSFISVSVGTIDSQILNNTGATTQQGEPSPCGVIGGSSKWFGLQPAGDGVMLLDTIGSAIDTVMAVYTGTNLFTLKLVACDNDSAPDGIRSLVRFPAATGVKYAVAVDGVNGAQGGINLNWKLGLAPTRSVPSSTLTVNRGGNTTLNASLSVNALSPIIFQWLFNEGAIAGANRDTLTLTNVQAGQAGTYSLIASNFAGVVTNTVAVIRVGTPIQLASGWVQTNGQTLFHLTGPSSQGFTIQASSNLVNWIGLYTNSTPSAVIDFRDPQTPINPRRFYRVIPWP